MRYFVGFVVLAAYGCSVFQQDAESELYKRAQADCAAAGVQEADEKYVHCLAHFIRGYSQESTANAPGTNTATQDAYGPGIWMDQYGRPIEWRTQDGQQVPPYIEIEQNTYGPGVGMDQYGRPVYPIQR